MSKVSETAEKAVNPSRIQSKTVAVSVIVPIYNAEKSLEKSLQSVLDQSFADWEMILVDAASSDSSLQIAQSFAERDSRIQVISLKGNNPDEARIPSNIGLRKARGKYVAFLNSDGWYWPEFIEKLYRHSEIFEEIDIALIGYQLYHSDKNKPQLGYADAWAWEQLLHPKLEAKRQRHKIRYVRLDQTRSAVRHRDITQAWSRIQAFYLLHGLSVLPWRKLYRRDFLLRHGIEFSEGEDSFEDAPLHWMACIQACNILFCDTIAYEHSVGRRDQTAGIAAEKQIQAKLSQADRVLDFLLQALEPVDGVLTSGRQELGQGAEFYLLLWLRDLLHTFCYSLRLSDLKLWEYFFQETESLLRRRLQTSVVLKKVVQPLHRLKLRDLYRLRLNILEMFIWQIFISRLGRSHEVEHSCDKRTRVFLFLLQLPTTQYMQALGERLRHRISRLYHS